jgi:alkanesulfonate monooxygenase SsuD/methylene tetrahydromethanopterin reductase-like flavin-dependent oxidoreductase (luciferase family)
MKFGIFYHLPVPKPWGPDTEYDVIQNSLDQVELADRLGLDNIWAGEHHFTTEYAHNSAPESFLAAASQRTEQIRLGHGIFHLTTAHPVRVAERAAFLDNLSSGRVELGLGEGGAHELVPFGVEVDRKSDMFNEAVRAIVPMFKGPMEHHGEFWDIPRREVVPKPRQKPHPPIWMACSRRESMLRAGQYGLGVLGFQFFNSESAHAWVHAYYNAFINDRHPLADNAPNPNLAFTSYFMCARTDEEARRRAEGCTFFQYCVLHPSMRTDEVYLDDMWAGYEQWKRENPEVHEGALHGGLIGSPETIAKKLRKFEKSNIDQVMFVTQAGRNKHEHICEALELFAQEVMPEFHANIPAHEEWKTAVINGHIVLEDLHAEEYTQKYSNKLASSWEQLPPERTGVARP